MKLQGKFLLSIIAIVAPVLGMVFYWVDFQTATQARDQALDQARVLARQVILTRQWVTDCGGAVLVAESSRGAQGIPCTGDGAVETSAGRFLQFTPAMVTRQLSLYSAREKQYSFKLSSLSPINPENAPDTFETAALQRFIRLGTGEEYRFSGARLDYLVPLRMEAGCLNCHDSLTNGRSAVIGSLSIRIPLERMEASLKKGRAILAVSGFSLTLVTVLILFFFMRRMVIKPLRTLEEKTIAISQGELEPSMAITTGDELEHLDRAFNTMSRNLLENRETLERRIDQATRDLAAANEDLKELDRLKSDFLANMSHELRSPLTVIRGGINYLSRTLEKPENRSYIEILDKNVVRLSRLVSDLFDFTKLEHGRIQWETDTENLTALVREAAEIIGPTADEKRISIKILTAEALFAQINLERIEQVLVNLLDNAIKFSDPGTVISIALARENQWITVSVNDQGPGIPEKNLVTIFDKFSTVPTGRNTKTEGTGLGLAISRAIIEAHGGRIWASSELGVSSTFFFSLPEAGPSDSGTNPDAVTSFTAL